MSLLMLPIATEPAVPGGLQLAAKEVIKAPGNSSQKLYKAKALQLSHAMPDADGTIKVFTSSKLTKAKPGYLQPTVSSMNRMLPRRTGHSCPSSPRGSRFVSSSGSSSGARSVTSSLSCRSVPVITSVISADIQSIVPMQPEVAAVAAGSGQSGSRGSKGFRQVMDRLAVVFTSKSGKRQAAGKAGTHGNKTPTMQKAKTTFTAWLARLTAKTESKPATTASHQQPEVVTLAAVPTATTTRTALRLPFSRCLERHQLAKATRQAKTTGAAPLQQQPTAASGSHLQSSLHPVQRLQSSPNLAARPAVVVAVRRAASFSGSHRCSMACTVKLESTLCAGRDTATQPTVKEKISCLAPISKFFNKVKKLFSSSSK